MFRNSRRYKTFSIFVFAIVLVSQLLSGCEEVPMFAGPFDHFRIMLNDDPSSTATVGWATATAPTSSLKLYYDTIDHGKDYTKYAFSHSISATKSHAGLSNNFVRLKNLRPKTTYYFVVSDEKNVSRRLWFETASDRPGDRLSLVVGGDSRNNRVPRKAANSLVAKLRPHAVVFGGDMTDNGTTGQWQEWMTDWQDTISADGRMTPVIIARGNHEASNSILVNLFDTPAGVYYGVTFGGNLMRVYTLNSESSIAGDQTNWLKRDLESSQGVQWKMAQYHRPMRPHNSGKPEGSGQYSYWAPLFEQYKVSLVSESDTHTVKYTWPLKISKSGDEGFVRDDQNGVVYIGEGCWGAPLRDSNDTKSWTRDSGKFNHFNWVFVDQSKIEVRTVKVDNAASVASLTDQNRFDNPAGIDIWAPNNGSTITIDR